MPDFGHESINSKAPLFTHEVDEGRAHPFRQSKIKSKDHQFMFKENDVREPLTLSILPRRKASLYS